MATARIAVIDEKEKAEQFVARLKMKGYKVSLVTKSDRVVVNTTDFGGTVHYIDDPDDECFIVVGEK